MPTIIGSTTVSVNRAAIAASTALPPPASISAPAAEASGWLVTTMPRAPMAGCLSQANGMRLRQPVSVICWVPFVDPTPQTAPSSRGREPSRVALSDRLDDNA